jgi:short subunit dehydrogenase-like uncharacterized protein
VRRSNALRGWAYGRRFRYREVMSVGTSPLSPLIAAGTKITLGALVAAMALPPTRFVIDRILPKPGEGPSERTRRAGHFTIDLFTTTSTGARYTARVKADSDPGYSATAIMIGEAALALALDRAGLPHPRVACSPRPPASATHWCGGYARPAWRSPPGPPVTRKLPHAGHADASFP